MHLALTNPAYAGPTPVARRAKKPPRDAMGVRRKRIQRLPREQWQVLITERHQDFIDWRGHWPMRRRPVSAKVRFQPHRVILRLGHPLDLGQ